MILFPNCKINLGLHITARRPDGYHEIESILYPLPLHDALEVIPAEHLSFNCDGIEIPGAAENNIVLKAYHLIKKDYPDLPFVNIFLLKKIPTGAGLGGGSADGAEMLKLLNNYFELAINNERLHEYASALGSDCPFFINNRPALAKGRGEILEPVSLDLAAYCFVIVKPSIHISTATAFSLIKPAATTVDLNKIVQQPIESWKFELKNDFEEPIFLQFPQINAIKKKLYELGALYCAMSGSGSAVYGIFRSQMEKSILDPIFKDESVFVCNSNMIH